MNIQEVAALAGVSVSTVSKVINCKDQDISEATRERVRKIIKQEGYIPYSKFRENDGLKMRLIGLIISKENRERDKIVLNMEEAARKQGYHLIINYIDESDEIEKYIREMANKNVSGFMIDSVKAVQERNRNIIYLSNTKKFAPEQRVTFYYRLSEAGILAAERLIKDGHEKIACITLKNEKSIRDGYVFAMRNANLSIHPSMVYEGEGLSDVAQYGIKQCLSENVTAIICGSPEIACEVCRELAKGDTLIPEDISIISIGDNQIMEYMGGGITSVKLPISQLCEEAVENLVNLIHDQKDMELMRKFAPVLIERNSVIKPMSEKCGDKIIVVGSLNMDVTLEVERIPVNGETQLAQRLYIFPGGKGGNQAVGAGKLGGRVYMLGRLGNDIDGKQIYSSLTENKVHVEGVVFDSSLPSGKAYINVDNKGESTIAVYQGANRNLNIEQINHYKYLFENAKYCLLSTEIQESIIEYAIKLCRRNDVKIILKPSAGTNIKEELLKDITYFVPNEKELHMFVRGEGTIVQKAKTLREKGVENVIVTLGSKGCYLENQDYSLHFPGTGFEAVDTTGGADSFISALAVYLSEGKPIIQSIEFAIYASGISVTRYGVQPALPTRKDVDVYKDEIYSKYCSRLNEK